MSEAVVVAKRKPRVEWVDYAKGICIFAVVMFQANTMVQLARGSEGWLEYVVSFARPFRMPDFFLIAGLFLSNVIDRPWRTYLDKKVVHFLYFFAIWSGIQFILFEARADILGGSAGLAGLIGGYLFGFVQPPGSLWFIHSLAVYFVLVRVTRWIPWWLIFAATAALQATGLHTGWVFLDEFALRFVYFYSGYRFAPHVFRIAEWALDHYGRAIGYLAVWAVMEQVFVSHGWARLPGISLMLGYLGAIAVIFASGLLSKAHRMSWLRYLGENSIVVYLGYYIVMSAAAKVLLPRVANTGNVALLVTVIAVFGAVLMFWALRRTPAWFLYRRPRWARIDRVPEARAGTAQAQKA
jgi:uncharacterized membrane protein YcfT